MSCDCHHRLRGSLPSHCPVAAATCLTSGCRFFQLEAQCPEVSCLGDGDRKASSSLGNVSRRIYPCRPFPRHPGTSQGSIFILLPVSSYLCSNLPRTYMFLIIPQWPSFFLYDASSYFSRVMFLFYNPGGPNFLRRERQDTAYPVK